MSSLTQRMFDEYGGFADKRIKRLDRGTTFVVDDRQAADVGADRKLLSYFCTILVDIARPEPLTPEALTVSLGGNVPESTAVEAWVKEQSADYQEGPDDHLLRFQVAPGEQGKLRSLAAAIRSIVARGAPRYGVTNYKYVCPRTARSLDRLADVLDATWREVVERRERTET